MKNALIDQILLGLFVFVALILFGATVSDEFSARNKVYKLDDMARHAAKALSKHYMYHEDMQEAEDIANNILQESKLGTELLNNNNITYTWTDTDLDGDPNAITATISNYQQSNFWYKFLGKNSFDIPPVEASYFITKDETDITSIHIRYDGSNAGYYNMIGTYELDENDCITNTTLLLANKDDYDIGDKLGSFTNLNTRFFIIANGYNAYGGNVSENDPLSITGCMDDNEAPTVTINNTTDAAPIYFQDTEFNQDNGYDHMHEVGKTYFDDYEEFITTPITYCSRYRRNGSCRQYSQREATWEDWDEYATEENIDYANDPNDEYIITMEDLPDGGDKDFNDINLDTTKVRTPRVPTQEDLDNGQVITP